MSRALVLVAFVILAAAAGPSGATTGAHDDPAAGTGTVALHGVKPPATPRGLRDEAAMVLVGTFLIGVAAAVRRAA